MAVWAFCHLSSPGPAATLLTDPAHAPVSLSTCTGHLESQCSLSLALQAMWAALPVGGGVRDLSVWALPDGVSLVTGTEEVQACQVPGGRRVEGGRVCQ